MTFTTSTQPITSVQINNPGGLPTMTTHPEPDPAALLDILTRYGQPDPGVVEKLRKSYKDKNGRWHEMELDYVGHATQTKWLIETDPTWNWEPVAWDEGRPKIHVNGDTAELWIRLTVLGKTVIGVGTAAASKSDCAKELIGDALRNASMRLGYALKLWSKGSWDDPTPPASTESSTQVDNVIDDPITWGRQEMMNATSVVTLDAVAAVLKTRLTNEQRAELRELYLTRKTELEGDHA